MMDRVLAVNPGATSTKIGYFEDDVLKAEKEFTYTLEDIAPYDTVIDQYDFRLNDIITWLEENNFEKDSFDAVVGRGGLLPPVNAGARSEEHTSELQSRGHLVCRLLLEKQRTG